MTEIKKKKMFVLDTSVILHDSKSIFSFEEHDISIPMQIFIELDKYKKGSEIINYNAREFIRFIDGLDSAMVFNGGAPIGENLGKIRVVVNPIYHTEISEIFSEKSMDHLIINTAFHLKTTSFNEYNVVFISKDINLRIKARSVGLIAQDYENDKIANTSALNEEVKKISLDPALVDALFKDGSVDYVKNKEEKLHKNEFVIINYGNPKSALAVFKNNKLLLIKKEDFSSFGIKPKNSEQAFALHALLDPEIKLIAITGNAGTGKTLISLASALEQLRSKTYEEVLFTRVTISVGNRDVGFLPGDIDDKIAPYMQGLYDNLSVIKSISSKNKTDIELYERAGNIKIEPIPYIRGRSLLKKIFIIDESQNMSQIETKTIITRAGEGTKIIVIGDLSQIDNPYLDERSNGLSHVIDKMQGQHLYSRINLLKGERSELAEIAGKLL